MTRSEMLHLALSSNARPPCRPRCNDVAPISRWLVMSTVSERTAMLRDDVRMIGVVRWCVALVVAIAIAAPTWIGSIS